MPDDDFSRGFYRKVGAILCQQMLPDCRLETGTIKTQSITVLRDFREVANCLQEEIAAALEFRLAEDEWEIAFAAWTHGDQTGDEPIRPQWPKNIPPYREALEVLTGIYSYGRWFDPIFVDSVSTLTFPLKRICDNLDRLKCLLESPEDDGSNGPIDKNVLAKLLVYQQRRLQIARVRCQSQSRGIPRTCRSTSIWRRGNHW